MIGFNLIHILSDDDDDGLTRWINSSTFHLLPDSISWKDPEAYRQLSSRQFSSHSAGEVRSRFISYDVIRILQRVSASKTKQNHKKCVWEWEVCLCLVPSLVGYSIPVLSFSFLDKPSVHEWRWVGFSHRASGSCQWQPRRFGHKTGKNISTI